MGGSFAAGAFGAGVQQDIAVVCDVAHDESQAPIIFGVGIANARVPKTIAVDGAALAQIGKLLSNMVEACPQINLGIPTEEIERCFISCTDVPAPLWSQWQFGAITGIGCIGQRIWIKPAHLGVGICNAAE